MDDDDDGAARVTMGLRDEPECSTTVAAPTPTPAPRPDHAPTPGNSPGVLTVATVGAVVRRSPGPSDVDLYDDGHDDDDSDEDDGHDDADSDEDDTGSDRTRSTSISTCGSGVLQTVARSMGLEPANGTPCIQGNVVVQDSTNVEFGNTHFHGPVTMVVAQGNGVSVNGPALDTALPLPLPAADIGDLHPVYDSATPLLGAKDDKGKAPLGFKKFLRWPRNAALGAALVVPAVALVVYFSMTTGCSIEVLSSGVKLATRACWHARKPSQAPELLKTPVDLVVVCHTATRNCFNLRVCAETVSLMQQYHKESHTWEDIAYNYLVSGDGVVYEGRGWDAVGAFAKGKNRVSLGVALIGNFEKEQISDAQEDQLRKFLDWGVALGKIAPNYKIGGACQYRETISPGRTFMQNLRTWPNWDPYMDSNKSCTG